MTFTITMRDEHLRPKGQIQVTSYKAVLRLHEVDTYTIQIAPADLPKLKRFKKGWGFIYKEDDLIISGPALTHTKTADNGIITYTYAGSSDLIHLANRLTLPSPLLPAGSQDTAYYQDAGPAETIIKNLIAVNAGPSARPDRITQGLTITPTTGAGKTTSVKTRLKSLLETAAALAKDSSLVLVCGQSPDSASAVFDVRAVRDKSRRVRLTVSAGELVGYTVSQKSPTVTAVIVGGQGEGADRALTEKFRSSEWGMRVESFKDRRDTDSSADLEKEAETQLDEGAEVTSLTFDVNDSQVRRFGRDFNVGDIIAVSVDGAEPFVEQVTAASLTWESGKRSVTLTVGNSDDDQVTSAEAQKIKKVSRQLLSLQTV